MRQQDMHAVTSVTTSSPAAGRGGETAPVLRTEGLTIRFGGLAALNNVNIAVNRGEIRAIIGPNGAGKRDRKSTRLNSSHIPLSRMPSSA